MLFAPLLAVGFVVSTLPCQETTSRLQVQRFLSMEYCTGCRWDFRAFWLVQELLDLEPDFHFWMIPSGEAGTFAVKSITGDDVFVKVKGGPFPDPSIDLQNWIVDTAGTTIDHSNESAVAQALSTMGNDKLPCVDIAYTREHRQRALYLAQECLRTFSDEVKSLSIRSLEDATSIEDLQVSVIHHNDATNLNVSIVWEKGLPETKVLKQKIRDVLVPEKALGHSDIRISEENSGIEDDKEASEARRYFGVA